MKKIKYLLLLNAKEALNELLQEKLPIKLSLKIIRNTDKISNEMEIFNQAQKQIADKYKITDNVTGKSKIIEEKFNDFKKEIDELLQTETELDLNSISINEIDTSNDVVKLKPATIKLLSEIGLITIDY